MRPVLVLFLLVGTTGTLSAEAPPKSSENDLARAYYQAAKANDFGKANAAFQELMDRFPDDDLSKLVGDHWNRRLKEVDPKSWKNISLARSRSLREDSLIVVVYQVADLVVPLPPYEKDRQKNERTAKAFMKMISDTLAHLIENEGKSKSGCAVSYHESTLSLVIRAPQGIHKKLETVLNQMRRQQDLQSTYDIKIVSVPAEIANSWALQETLSPKEFKNRMEEAEQSDQFEVTKSPQFTTFDGQIARINTDFSNISLHGKISKDRRSTRLEIMLGIDGEADIPNWFFSASETILDGHTGVFFIRSEGAPSRGLDRRLFIEKGIEVAPSSANQYFALITAKIIVLEEEEELLGLPEESTTSTKPLSPRPPVGGWPAYPGGAWPSYGSAYPSYPNSSSPGWWRPRKLEWDDGNWNLNFDTDNKTNAIDAWDLNWPSQAIRYRKDAEKRVPNINPLPKRRR